MKFLESLRAHVLALDNLGRLALGAVGAVRADEAARALLVARHVGVAEQHAHVVLAHVEAAHGVAGQD